MNYFRFNLFLISLLLSHAATPVFAGCCAGESEDVVFDRHNAVAEVKVLSSQAFKDANGRIFTRHHLQTLETFKGNPPADFTLETPGGTVGNEAAVASDSLNLVEGQSVVLHLDEKPDKSWTTNSHRARLLPKDITKSNQFRKFFRGKARQKSLLPKTEIADDILALGSGSGNTGVPGSIVTASGFFEENGVPCRYTEGDSGRTIPYLVDIIPGLLPTGMSPDQALEIVDNAFQAWAASSTLRFKFDGLANFGASSESININDGKIRVQLHDFHNGITNNDILGRGGVRFYTDNQFGFTTGGKIGSRTFNSVARGWVIINHRPSLIQNFNTFTEVVTHEIGHAIGLQHSSENLSEPNAILKDATMFINVHSDGRGYGLRLYDLDRINYAYSPTNSPPYGMNRYLTFVSASPQPSGAGIDRVTLTSTSGDLQLNSTLTYSLVAGSAIGEDPTTGIGTFSLVEGNAIRIAQRGVFNDTRILTETELANNVSYGSVLYVVSDGANTSPPYHFRILGARRDTTRSDSLPDTWMITYFGSTAVGAVGSDRHPDSDPDKDGLSNRLERYLDTHPLDPKSGPPPMSFDPNTGLLTMQPVRFAPYLLQKTTNLTTWTTIGAYTTSQAAPGPVTFNYGTNPSEPVVFYRALTAP